MANKLKDIFSDASPEFVSTVKFKDADAYHDFYTALGKVENEGNSVPIEGIDSISLFLQENGGHPYDQTPAGFISLSASVPVLPARACRGDPRLNRDGP